VVNATVDIGAVESTVARPPRITTANSTTFTVGQFGTSQVITTCVPTAP
jgi:hypothetical protein